MKAIVWTEYGPPEGLQPQEVEKPVPRDHEVLIRVRAATVTAGDSEMRKLQLPFSLGLPIRLYTGLRRPTRVRILGQELAGEVEAVGSGVTRFKEGDEVFGTTGFAFGSYAEYNCLPAVSDDGALALKPVNVSFEEAAAAPTAGLEALHFHRIAGLQKGQRLLINGAGGSIGTFTLQLAKLSGVEVTAVDSVGKLDMLRSLGADRVIDYAREDFTRSGQTYHAILDVVGKAHYARGIQSLNPNGYYMVANPSISLMFRGRWTTMTTSKKVVLRPSAQTVEDLLQLKELIEEEKVKVIIDRTYPLEQTAEAHAYVETGQKKGNVVIAVSPTGE
jgi:NADPH:quinone reductase-like Zn-dependent oxidoreductase